MSAESLQVSIRRSGNSVEQAEDLAENPATEVPEHTVRISSANKLNLADFQNSVPLLRELAVVNDGDRPVQVGSHFHFAEANEALTFDRSVATGRRLAVPAGTSVRFEPGVPTTVLLVDLAGEQVAAGFRGLHGGPVTFGEAS